MRLSAPGKVDRRDIRRLIDVMDPSNSSIGVGPRHALYVDNPVFSRAAYGSQHPLAIARTETVSRLARTLGWLPQSAFKTSAAASLATLCRFHGRDYAMALRAADRHGKVDREWRQRYGFGTMENPLFAGVFERAATAVGGSILAAELSLEQRVVFHPAGGTHHGQPGRASGFCYFNDPVFAIMTLLDAGLDRVLYVDLDAHHGDGVEAAFRFNPRVHLLSVHEIERWPYTGKTSVGNRICNLPVAKGCDDHAFRTLMADTALPFASNVEPQAIVITCGADALAGDPLSSMRLSNVALWQAVEQFTMLAPAVVVLGGGGYNPWTLARCWAGLWARLAGFEIPAALPDRAQRILAALECDLVDEQEIEHSWLSSIADRPPFYAARHSDE
jgi:acetoin utilization protein AcuC